MNTVQERLHIAVTAGALITLSSICIYLANTKTETVGVPADVLQKLAAAEETAKDVSALNTYVRQRFKENEQTQDEWRINLTKRLSEHERSTEGEISRLASEIKSVNAEITTIEREAHTFKITTEAHQDVIRDLYSELANVVDVEQYFDPASPGYSILWTNHGALAVSINEVTPYMTGSHVTIGVINMSSVELTEFEVTARWANLPQGVDITNIDKDQFSRWDKEASMKVFSSTKVMKPGVLVEVVMLFSGYKHDQNGLVKLGNIKFGSINYSKAR